MTGVCLKNSPTPQLTGFKKSMKSISLTSGRSSTTLSGLRHTFESLANRQFRFLWFGLLFAQASMQINIVARSWLAYSISGSAVALGLVALARGLPMSLLSLLGGALADRSDKRTLLIMVQFSLAALSLVNALLVHLDIIRVWHLVVIGLFQGVIFAFNMPTRQALIPEVVPKESVSNALALNATGMNLNRILAPALAGVLIASHPAVAFDVVAVFYLAAGLMLFLLPKIKVDKTALKGNAFGDIVDGITYMFRHRQLLALIAMAFIPTMIGMPYRQLLPVFQQDVLHVGPSALGLMYTLVGIGAFIGSLSVAAVSKSPHKNLLQGLSGVLFGAFLIMFALSSLFHLSLILLAVVGLMSQGYMTLNSVLIMEMTDSAYYGRIMSIYMLTFSMAPVAMLPFGFLVDHFGVSRTEAAAGLILAIIMLVLLYFRRRFESNSVSVSAY
jgi:MFS family permease